MTFSQLVVSEVFILTKAVARRSLDAFRPDENMSGLVFNNLVHLRSFAPLLRHHRPPFPGSPTSKVLGLEIGPGVDEPLRHLPMAIIGRPVEGRPTSGRINPVATQGVEHWQRRDRRGNSEGFALVCLIVGNYLQGLLFKCIVLCLNST